MKTNKEISDYLEIAPLGDALAEEGTALSVNDGVGKRAFVSLGERVHKWGTYLSVDWIFNAATGVGFAYWGKYSELGKRMWSGPITRAFTKALAPFIKNPKQLKSSAGYGNMFMSVIAGGMFTIPPLMILESRKIRKSIAKAVDEAHYGKDAVANDPKFAEAYDEIENAPKKDFNSGLISRFVALSPLLAMVLIPTTKKISNKLWFDHVERASGMAARKMGFSPDKSFTAVGLPEAKERWKFIHESVAMDFGLGVPYAVLHAYFYDMFARKKKAGTMDNAEAEKSWVERTQCQEKCREASL